MTMESTRKFPPIDSDTDVDEDIRIILLGVVIGVISLTAALLITLMMLKGWEKTRNLGLLFFWLCITLLFWAQTGMSLDAILEGISKISKRNRWLRKAIRIPVKIVDRKHDYQYDQYAETWEEMTFCSITVLVSASTTPPQPERVVPLKVSERIYSRYLDRDAARIFCDSSDPEVFILEGE